MKLAKSGILASPVATWKSSFGYSSCCCR